MSKLIHENSSCLVEFRFKAYAKGKLKADSLAGRDDWEKIYLEWLPDGKKSFYSYGDKANLEDIWEKIKLYDSLNYVQFCDIAPRKGEY